MRVIVSLRVNLPLCDQQQGGNKMVIEAQGLAERLFGSLGVAWRERPGQTQVRRRRLWIDLDRPLERSGGHRVVLFGQRQLAGRQVAVHQVGAILAHSIEKRGEDLFRIGAGLEEVVSQGDLAGRVGVASRVGPRQRLDLGEQTRAFVGRASMAEHVLA